MDTIISILLSTEESEEELIIKMYKYCYISNYDGLTILNLFFEGELQNDLFLAHYLLPLDEFSIVFSQKK